MRFSSRLAASSPLFGRWIPSTTSSSYRDSRCETCDACANFVDGMGKARSTISDAKMQTEGITLEQYSSPPVQSKSVDGYSNDSDDEVGELIYRSSETGMAFAKAAAAKHKVEAALQFLEGVHAQAQESNGMGGGGGSEDLEEGSLNNDMNSCVPCVKAVTALEGGTNRAICHTVSKSQAAWEKRFRELEAFKSKYGHCNVPQKYKTNPGLGMWLSRERHEMRKLDAKQEEVEVGNEREKAMKQRMSRLKELGVVFYIGTGQVGKKDGKFPSCHSADVWERHFTSLLKYRGMHGHCNVPTAGRGEYKPLGRWVSAQRKAYQEFCSSAQVHKDEALESRFQRLRDVGFRFVIGKGKGENQRYYKRSSEGSKSL